MPRVSVTDSTVTLWASARDTYEWASRPGASWPCSALAGKRFAATFDRNGLADFTLNGRHPEVVWMLEGNELSCCAADLLKASGKVPDSHPAYYVAIEQHLPSI